MNLFYSHCDSGWWKKRHKFLLKSLLTIFGCILMLHGLMRNEGASRFSSSCLSSKVLLFTFSPSSADAFFFFSFFFFSFFFRLCLIWSNCHSSVFLSIFIYYQHLSNIMHSLHRILNLTLIIIFQATPSDRHVHYLLHLMVIITSLEVPQLCDIHRCSQISAFYLVPSCKSHF